MSATEQMSTDWQVHTQNGGTLEEYLLQINPGSISKLRQSQHDEAARKVAELILRKSEETA